MTVAGMLAEYGSTAAVLSVQGAMLIVVRDELKRLRADVRLLRESWAAKFGEPLKGG